MDQIGNLEKGKCVSCGAPLPYKIMSMCDVCAAKAIEHHERMERQRELDRSADGSDRRMRLFLATLPEKYRGMSFERGSWDGTFPAKEDLWLRCRQASCLVYYGPVGSGKTHRAVAFTKRYMELFSVTARYVSGPELAANVRDAIDRKADSLIPKWKEVQLLLIDDAHRIGAGLAHEAFAEVMFYRHGRCMPTILTLNRNPKEMYLGTDETVGDQALWSRILERALFEKVESNVDRRL